MRYSSWRPQRLDPAERRGLAWGDTGCGRAHREVATFPPPTAHRPQGPPPPGPAGTQWSAGSAHWLPEAPPTKARDHAPKPSGATAGARPCTATTARARPSDPLPPAWTRGRTCSSTVLGVTFTVWRRPFGASTDTAEPPPPAGAAIFRSRDPRPALLQTTLSATAGSHSHAAAGAGPAHFRGRLLVTPPCAQATPPTLLRGRETACRP